MIQSFVRWITVIKCCMNPSVSTLISFIYKSLSKQKKHWIQQWNSNGCVPSTKEVNSVTFAAFLRPAGRLSPSLSSFSLRHRPPFFDLALNKTDAERLLSTRVISHISHEDLPCIAHPSRLQNKAFWESVHFTFIIKPQYSNIPPTFHNDHRRTPDEVHYYF